jgi:hypothetical protein
MRFSTLALATGAALAMMAAPAQAQWKAYVSRDLGFSFTAPGEVKAEKGTYKGERSGEHPAIIFRSVADNIEYKATVVDFTSQLANGPSLFEEAVVVFQGRNKVLMDNYGRIGGLYGRKGTVEIPNNGGRSMSSFYFTNGHLYQMQATLLPAHDDPGTPDAARFVDSETFNLNNLDPGTIELKLPN